MGSALVGGGERGTLGALAFLLFCGHLFASFPVLALPFILLSPPLPLSFPRPPGSSSPTVMASQDKGRPLPKFGEWDVNNPASAEGFTVIFNKARDEKKTNATGGTNLSPQRPTGGYKPDEDFDFPTKRKWFCCG